MPRRKNSQTLKFPTAFTPRISGEHEDLIIRDFNNLLLSTEEVGTVISGYGLEIQHDLSGHSTNPAAGLFRVGSFLMFTQENTGAGYSLRFLNLTTGTIGTSKNMTNATSNYTSIFIKDDKAYCFNPGQLGFYFPITDPTTVTDMGLTRPDSSNALVDIDTSDGLVYGLVRYFIAEMNGDTESPLSEFIPISGAPSQKAIDAGNGSTISLNFTHADYHGKRLKIYRTRRDGSAGRLLDYYDVPASVGGTYIDNIPDGSLGPRPLFNGDPPSTDIAFAVIHKGRAFGLTISGRLYWADAGNIQSWLTDEDFGNWLDVFPDDQDACQFLGRDRDNLIVWKGSHIYVVEGAIPLINPVEITLADSRESIGLNNSYSIERVKRIYYFINDHGIYEMRDIGSIRDISLPINSELRQWSPNTTLSCLGFDPNMDLLLVHFGDPVGNLAPPDTEFVPESTTYVYDIENERWIGRNRNSVTNIDNKGFKDFGVARYAPPGPSGKSVSGYRTVYVGTQTAGLHAYSQFKDIFDVPVYEADSGGSFQGNPYIEIGNFYGIARNRKISIKRFYSLTINSTASSSNKIVLKVYVDDVLIKTETIEKELQMIPINQLGKELYFRIELIPSDGFLVPPNPPSGNRLLDVCDLVDYTLEWQELGVPRKGL